VIFDSDGPPDAHRIQLPQLAPHQGGVVHVVVRRFHLDLMKILLKPVRLIGIPVGRRTEIS
jgi:hypothetical protein